MKDPVTSGSTAVDAPTVERAVAGDRVALRTLHDATRASVHRVARSFAAFDADDVEDVVQETYVRAFRSLGRLADRERFLAWLLTIARNTALSRLARRSVEASTYAALGQEMEALGSQEVPARDPGLESEIELVRRLVAALPEGPEKETVHLFYVEGKLSAREIGERLGVGKSTITMRLERFRAKVKQRILAEVAAVAARESRE